MKTRKLGNITVSAIGMGCMGFTHAYGKTPEEREGIRLVHKAFEMGCTLFDTAEMYSYFGNEEFVGKALKGLPREKVIISDKFWPEKLPGHDFSEDKLSETGIRKSLEGSLRRLQTDYIDIYTEHQMREGNEEEVAYIMGKLIQEGKIRGWGAVFSDRRANPQGSCSHSHNRHTERIFHDGTAVGKRSVADLP